MASKFLVACFRPWILLQTAKNVPQKTFSFPQAMTVNSSRGLLTPPTQYDVRLSDNLKLRPIEKHYEKVPLIIMTMASMSGAIFSIVWAVFNKVDVVYRTHSRRNISRTMDLLRPTVHKLYTIEQRYDPWPQMHTVLNKMKMEHCRRMEKKRQKAAATVC